MSDPINKRYGANLPHWTRDGAIYFITTRLADSLPAHAIAKLRAEAALLERQAERGYVPMTPAEEVRLAKLKSEAYLKLLDSGYGECLLRRDDVAEIVANALKHFDGKRYRLLAWCIMPNHFHVVLQLLGGFELPDVLHSWKSFSAKQVNKLLGRAGEFWQAEYYDHLVRDEADFLHCVNYTLQNPVVGGLRDWKWVGGLGQEKS